MDKENEKVEGDALEPWVEPALEARLVAMLVGEASDFERSELERVLEDRPEARVFHRRMKAVDALLREVESSASAGGGTGGGRPVDKDWRLSPARRKAVLRRIRRTEPPTRARKAPEVTTGTGSAARAAWKPRPWLAPLLGAAAAVMVTGAVVFSLSTFSSFTTAEADSKSVSPRQIAAVADRFKFAIRESVGTAAGAESVDQLELGAGDGWMWKHEPPADQAPSSAPEAAARPGGQPSGPMLSKSPVPVRRVEAESIDSDGTTDFDSGFAVARGESSVDGGRANSWFGRSRETAAAATDDFETLDDAASVAGGLVAGTAGRGGEAGVELFDGGSGAQAGGSAGGAVREFFAEEQSAGEPPTDQPSRFGDRPAPSTGIAAETPAEPASGGVRYGFTIPSKDANGRMDPAGDLPEEAQAGAFWGASKLAEAPGLPPTVTTGPAPAPARPPVVAMDDKSRMLGAIVDLDRNGRDFHDNDRAEGTPDGPGVTNESSPTSRLDSSGSATDELASTFRRTARDVTRAEMLDAVDELWESAVPSEPGDAFRNGDLAADGESAQTQGGQEAPPATGEPVDQFLRDAPESSRRWAETREGRIAGRTTRERVREEGAATSTLDLALSDKRSLIEEEPEKRLQAMPSEAGVDEYGIAERKSQPANPNLPGLTADGRERQAIRGSLEDNQALGGDVPEDAESATAMEAVEAEVANLESKLVNSINGAKQVREADRALSLEALKEAVETDEETGPATKIDANEDGVADEPDPAEWEKAKRQMPAAEEVPDPLDIETLASAEPFSTFSLHVSDVSFKLAADALIGQGTWPDPAKVRIEEFVNAFDYGDPPATLEDKVACRLEQAVHPFRQQRNLMRVSMRTAAIGRAASQPLHLTILLDKSGSMEREDREASVLLAMDALASHLGAGDVVTVIGFARSPRLIADRVPGDRAAELVPLVEQTPSEGGTNLEEALRLAGESARRQFLEGAQNRIVLLTDGAANLGNADPDVLRERVVQLRHQGIAFDACGVGAEGLNDAILEALTREGDGRYYFLNRPEDADEGFVRQLAGALRPAARNVKIQVRFNPERVGGYRLLGFEQHRLEKEDFRDDSVDAAELADAEAGVAVYQVEVLPDGRGEVGEVSVRFQDTATGRMVERTWTIAHDPSPPRLDGAAAPSMQLAAVAALLGEKLRGGPAAAAVELGELIPVTNTLHQAFPSSERVDTLIEMVRQADSLSR